MDIAIKVARAESEKEDSASAFDHLHTAHQESAQEPTRQYSCPNVLNSCICSALHLFVILQIRRVRPFPQILPMRDAYNLKVDSADVPLTILKVYLIWTSTP